MVPSVRVWIDGEPHEASAGLSVAALLLGLGRPSRLSVSGQARAPFCGMGVCGECRVAIDGEPSALACLVPCRDGLHIRTRT
ncbi:MAG TPA: (2Fe-2S)-binding protein [Burkholderiaceae bacterium]|jgi:aerobic-type carbon monoxide dehydrogenase small subunit (CoxS/CutS family)|nr:(2Fe-2S)-binding protein [Burkholderiaceae bacterium]